MRVDPEELPIELASGIDSLYCSGRADVPMSFLRELELAKEQAQILGRETDFALGGAVFRVQRFGFRHYPYVLMHEYGMVGVTDSDTLPALKIQPYATFLHGVGAQAAVDWFRHVLEGELGSIRLNASRFDLHADWQGWDLDGNDRSSFVCKADSRVLHEEAESFTGLRFGLRKTGTVSARFYDKQREMLKSGSAYWEDIWGHKYNPEKPVLRLEFEFGRQGLSEFGLDTPEDAIEAAGGLWLSATEWLSYRIPSGDSTKSRWPVAPEWEAIRRAKLVDTPIGLDRIYEGRRRGEYKLVVPNLVGYMVSYAALFGLNSVEEACNELLHVVPGFCDSRGLSFEKRVHARRRKIGMP